MKKMSNEESIDRGDLPTFDGRLQYYDVWKKYWNTYGEAMVTDDLMLRIRTLKGLLSMSRPFFLNKKDIDLVDQNMNDAIRLGVHKHPLFVRRANHYLEVAERLIVDNTKHLMLPYEEHDDLSFDEDDFVKKMLKESGA